MHRPLKPTTSHTINTIDTNAFHGNRPHPRTKPRLLITNATDSSSDGKTNPLGKSERVSPWELMGRMVNTQNVFSTEHVQIGLMRHGAAQAASLSIEEFEMRLDRLLALFPFLQPRLARLNPKLLAALVNDVDSVSSRVIELKILLPDSNVESIVSQRPSILLDNEWNLIEGNLNKLRKHYKEEDISRMVAVEPVLLVEDIEEILKELSRFPSLTNPQHGGVVGILCRDPSLVHSIARGTDALGPGAEFMRDI